MVENPDSDSIDDLDKLLAQKEMLEGLIRSKFTKHVTVMFTDMKGSTSLADREGDLSSRALIRDHNNIVFPLVENNGGVLVKTMGDGTLSYFNEAQGALRAAVAIQREFQQYNNVKKFKEPILLRVGMHTGEVMVEKNDIFGDVVNTASRFESSAAPGDIQLSEITFNELADKDEFLCKFSRETKLKGKEATFKVYRVVWDPVEIERELTGALEDEACDATATAPASSATAMVAPAAPAATEGAATARAEGSGSSKEIAQAHFMAEGEELVQLLLYCESGQSVPGMADIQRELCDEMERGGSRNVRHFGEGAVWYYRSGITTGRLQDADMPLTNRAISRAPVTLGIKGGYGFIAVRPKGSESVSQIDVLADGNMTTVEPGREYSLGKSGRITFSQCFTLEYHVFRDRFLVMRWRIDGDCVQRTMNMTLADVWRNHQAEAGSLIVIGR